MGFTDEDFDKAKWKHETVYLKGGKIGKCNAKLMVVKEKPKQENTETFVLCTTKDFPDAAAILTEWMKYIGGALNEKSLNVNFAIEKLEKSVHLECATNTTKCIEYMGMRFLVTENQDQKATDIIVLAKKGNMNTEKCMKITTELSLNPHKLYTILTLTALIIESKIFGSTTQRVNIKGHIPNIDVYENYIQMQLSFLEMESTSENMSNSMLYKQAGNSICKNVLMAIFKQIIDPQ